MSSKLEIRIARDGGNDGTADSVAAAAKPASVAEPGAKEVVAASTAAEIVAMDAAPAAAIRRLDAAIGALDAVDFASWSDSALRAHLDEVSLVLCRVDAQLARLADAVRARGFAITEVDLPLAS